MAIIDLVAGTNKLLNDLGIGNLWNLSQGSFITPSGNTFTFLDIGSQIAGGINLSLVPTAQEIVDAIKKKLLGGADGSGSTILKNDTFESVNNIIGYQLPDDKELLFQWGTKRTSVQSIILLCNGGYVAKAQYSLNLFGEDLGMQGGTLLHPLFGILPNTFVENVRFISGDNIFNGSLCIVKFSSPNTFNINTVASTPFLQQATDIINALNANLAAIASQNDIQTELKVLTNNPFFTNNENGISLDGSLLTDSYFSNIGINPADYPAGYENGLCSVSQPLSSINLQLSNAALNLTANGLPTDFNIAYQTQLVTELLCQIGKIVVGNYGNGGLSNTTVSTIIVDQDTANTLVYTRSYYNNNGQLVQINQQISKVIGSEYYVTVTTTTTTFINASNSFSFIRNLINDIIVASTVYQIVYPDSYIVYASIIANLKTLYSLIISKEGDTWQVPYDMSLFTAAYLNDISTEQLLQRNSNLFGFKPLVSGMVLYL